MFRSEDGKVRAVHPAKVATAAFVGGYDVRGMVTLGVESRRKSQNVGGAELDAEAATFAAFDGNGNKPFGHENPP